MAKKNDGKSSHSRVYSVGNVLRFAKGLNGRDQMTDAEKMIEMMMVMGKAASEETQTQFDTAANMLRMAYDSYIKAGFSPKMAFELTKEVLHASIVAGVKK